MLTRRRGYQDRLETDKHWQEATGKTSGYQRQWWFSAHRTRLKQELLPRCFTSRGDNRTMCDKHWLANRKDQFHVPGLKQLQQQQQLQPPDYSIHFWRFGILSLLTTFHPLRLAGSLWGQPLSVLVNILLLSNKTKFCLKYYCNQITIAKLVIRW